MYVVANSVTSSGCMHADIPLLLSIETKLLERFFYASFLFCSSFSLIMYVCKEKFLGAIFFFLLINNKIMVNKRCKEYMYNVILSAT